MRVGSVFTGVGGADLGFEAAGMTISWQCEIDAWKRSVLAAHWSNVPIYEDVTTLTNPEPVDLMVGGFPCQDLSIAGRRKGFDGERSVLAFEFLRLAESIAPRWIVLENVPGLLSSNRGRDFARLLDEVVGCGYGVSWRVTNAQHFGVPQRRRRVFVVARRADAEFDSGGASRLALRALLEGGSGDSTSCVPPWQEAAGGVGGGVENGRSIFNATAQFGQWEESDAAGTLSKRDYKSPNHLLASEPVSFYSTGGSQNGFWSTEGVSPTLKVGSSLDIPSPVAIASSVSAQAYSIREDNAANTFSATPVDTARCLQKHQPSINSHHAQNIVAQVFPINDGRAVEKHMNGTGIGDEGAPAYTLDRQQHASVALPQQMSVRRLSPLECERLMGFPDNWTAPPGVKASDSKRYAACGDGIVANVAYWIGQRIMLVDKETHSA